MKAMKKRSTTPVLKSLALRGSIVVAAVLMAAAVPMAFFGGSAAARDYEAEIRAVQRQIDQYNAEAAKLSKKADTLQNRVAKFNREISILQAEIDLKQAEHDKLVADIKANEKKIAENQDHLGRVMADMYVDDDISPLEMLASSDNIADYIDRQAQRTSIRDALKGIIDEIKALKEKLEKQKVEVKAILDDQTNQRNALAARKAEQQQLLDDTRGQESAYKRLSAEARKKREEIERQQQAAIAAAYARGNGGMIAAGNLPAYQTWAGVNCWVDNAGYSHNGARPMGQDPVGYGCNQCVSYTAWKMGQEIGYIPSYWGNANMWPASARAHNASVGFERFKVTSTPRANAIGVISAGRWGHVVYIESYDASTHTVNISQYNEWLPGKGYGHYSTRTGVSAATYDTYIYL